MPTNENKRASASEPDQPIALLKALASAWNDDGIRYGVVHGLEGYPSRCGRDIDVLIEESDGLRAIDLATGLMRREGWMCSIYPSKLGVVQIFALRKNQGRWTTLEIDLLLGLRLQWGPVCLVNSQSFDLELYEFDGIRIYPWASFVKRLLIQALAGNWKRLEGRPHDFIIATPELPFVHCGLVRFFGTDCAALILESVDKNDVSGLRRLIPQLKSRLFHQSVLPSNWRASASTCLRWVHGEWVAKIAPRHAAPVVAVVGPDGVGKSSALRELLRLIERDLPFPKVIYRHWRPNVLPRLGAFVGKPPPKPNADGLLLPRRSAGRFGLFRKLYYFIDFQVGYWAKDRIASSNLFLTLYDRCFLDMIVDPIRFGLADGALLTALYRLLPHPDLVVLLLDEPERIHARKAELPVVEIALHLERWRELERKGLVHCVVDVKGTPEDVATVILEHVVVAFQKILQRHN